MSFAPDSPWTDADGVAARFGVTRKTIYDWMKLELPIPSQRVGGRRRFFIPDVDAWAHSRWSLYIAPDSDARCSTPAPGQVA
jgi:predicted DNA-binding transcriptional regulator AlpA